MENQVFSPVLEIKGNLYCPDVFFNAKEGQLVLNGRSVPENAVHFYEPIMEWIDMYLDCPAEVTIFHMKMEYFNTSSSKFILSIIEKLEELETSGKKVEVYWYYGDEDMAELGEDYSHILSIPFKLIEFSFSA